MKRVLAIAAGLSLTAGALGLAQAAVPTPETSSAYTGQKLAAKAHVTMAQARVIALKARPGQITDQELENEGGGSGLRYSFDIKSAGKIHEVGVDGMTGKVLENQVEGPNPD
ncbi:MAG: PepSY domain-containing protein [bacterium]|nr:PepSY domain-containing protein [bacterium]